MLKTYTIYRQSLSLDSSDNTFYGSKFIFWTLTHKSMLKTTLKLQLNPYHSRAIGNLAKRGSNLLD